VIGAVVFSGAFAVGVAFSAEGVALAYTIAFIAILPFCMSYAGRSAGIQLKDIARASGWPMLWALCTAGSVKIITMSFSTSWSPIPRVALAAVTGTAITLIWITRISPDLLQQVRRFLSVRDGSGQEREV
jgi:hypothetical protein